VLKFSNGHHIRTHSDDVVVVVGLSSPLTTKNIKHRQGEQQDHKITEEKKIVLSETDCHVIFSTAEVSVI
jgi:hypothetical protein